MNIASLRREYAGKPLTETGTDADPIKQFGLWFAEAIECNITDANAMSLATADLHGRPSNRIVLLKGFDARGFIFYTNFQSHKGKELEANPFAALNFYWHVLDRQVRIEGEAEKIADEESDEYFESRPEGSRIGAWASPQSQEMTKEELDAEERDFRQKFEGKPIPRPVFWGGYVVKPVLIEFWQGKPNRLHDRVQYTKSGDHWNIKRLAP